MKVAAGANEGYQEEFIRKTFCTLRSYMNSIFVLNQKSKDATLMVDCA